MSRVLLSVKPEIAEAIISGKKMYEFRKTRCCQDVTGIVFYATNPIRQVVCKAEVDYALEGEPSVIWENTKSSAGVSREFYDAYFAGKKTATAYHLKNVTVFDTPRQLSDYGVKSPPQSNIYII